MGARAEGADGRSRMLSLDSEGPSLPREVSRAAGPQMQSRAARTGSGLPGAHNLLWDPSRSCGARRSWAR